MNNNEGEFMQDIRISVRLAEKNHYALKLIALEKKISIQQILHEYILKIIEESKNEKN